MRSGSTTFPDSPTDWPNTELGPLLHQQAEVAGAEFVLDTVEKLEASGIDRIVHGAGENLRARAVIIAAGSVLRPLGVAGEEKFLGKGVSHCATCDGAFFAGREVCVVGGGNSALDEALMMAAHASRVTVFHRGTQLDAQQVLRDRVAANDRSRSCCRTWRRGGRRQGRRHRRAPARGRDRPHARRGGAAACSSMSASSPTPRSCAAFSRSMAPATSRPTSTCAPRSPKSLPPAISARTRWRSSRRGRRRRHRRDLRLPLSGEPHSAALTQVILTTSAHSGTSCAMMAANSCHVRDYVQTA